VAQVGLHVFYRFNPHARDLPISAPEPQQAVYTALPTGKDQPILRLSAAIVLKPDAAPAPAAPAAGKDAKAVVKAPEPAEPEIKASKPAEVTAS
jgi:hypothetical protein